jgi:hypothetical protein
MNDKRLPDERLLGTTVLSWDGPEESIAVVLEDVDQGNAITWLRRSRGEEQA